MAFGKVLIDGDIIAYRAAFATQDKLPKDAEEKAEELIQYILQETLVFPSPNDYKVYLTCLLYTSPSPRDRTRSRMPSSA